MSRKKDPNKKVRYRNYSFRCTVGDHDSLIKLLDSQTENERSDAIRDWIASGAKLPRRPQPKIVDLETLRRELAVAVEEILTNIPAYASGDTTSKVPQPKRQDVNDMGGRIPDFS